MERFRQRYGIALTKKKLQEIILMLMAWEADLAMYARKQEYYRGRKPVSGRPVPGEGEAHRSTREGDAN